MCVSTCTWMLHPFLKYSRPSAWQEQAENRSLPWAKSTLSLPCSISAGMRSRKAGSSLQVGITIFPLSSVQILGGKFRIWTKSSYKRSYWLEWTLEHVLSHSILLTPCYFPFPTPSFLFWCNAKDFWESQKGKACNNLKSEHFLVAFNAYIQHFILRDLL